MISYEKALQWQELFDLAVRDGMSEEDLVDLGYRIGGLYIHFGLDLMMIMTCFF